MPSAGDFFNEVKATNHRLDTLIASTDGVRSSVDIVAAKIDQGLAIESTIRDAVIHQIKQNETIICLLKQIADSTCRSLNEAHVQTGLQHTIRDSTTTLADLYAMTHAEAALIRERERALKAQIEACCPPKLPEAACHPTPCPDAGSFAGPAVILTHSPPGKGRRN